MKVITKLIKHYHEKVRMNQQWNEQGMLFLEHKVKVKVMDLYSTFQMGYTLPKALYM